MITFINTTNNDNRDELFNKLIANAYNAIEDMIKDLNKFLYLDAYNDADIAMLKSNFDQIKKLESLNGSKVSFSYKQPFHPLILDNMYNLRELSVVCEDLKFLEKLPNLTKLQIGYSEWWQQFHKLKNLDSIGSCKNLLELRFNVCMICDLGFLKELSKLESLVICGYSDYDKYCLNLENIDEISSLKNLKTLFITSYSGGIKKLIKAISPLTKLENLSLKLPGTYDLGPLHKLRNLKSLTLGCYDDYNYPITNANVFKNYSNLKYLDVDRSHYIKDIHYLSFLTNLEELNCSIHGAESLDCLAELYHLRKLNISAAYYLRNIDFLAKLVNLVELKMKYLKVVKNLSVISNLVNLEVLDLYANGIPQIDLSQLSDKSQEIELRSCGIKNIWGLGNLNNLKRLSIQSHSIDSTLNKNILELGNLTNLKKLTIEGRWP